MINPNVNPQSVDQQPTTQPAVSGDQGREKTFTQAELDEIIQTRLKRERETTYKRAQQEFESGLEARIEAEIEKRQLVQAAPAVDPKEADLQARESKLECRAYLLDCGYPSELLDVLDTSDPKEFKSKADTLSRLLTPRKATPLASTEGKISRVNSFQGPDQKHKPRDFPPYNQPR